MRILVTGGAGYIGSHTVLELLLAGHQVLVVDNLHNGHRQALERVKELSSRDCDFEQLDICAYSKLVGKLAKFKPEAVIHFAGLKSVSESVHSPLRYYENNVSGTVSLLKAMDAVGCDTIVFSSSATVYGEPDYLPYTEEHPTRPVNPYGQTKLMAERILTDWAHSGGRRRAVALRYFNPIGAHPSGFIGEDPNGPPNNLMPFVAQVAVGKRKLLSVYGNDYKTRDGTGERDYIHVVDLARAHVAALECPRIEQSFEIFNIGTGSATSVLDLLREFEQWSGQPIRYEFAARRKGDIASSWADTSRAKIRLGWSAALTLAEMCRDTWTWQSKNPEGYG